MFSKIANKIIDRIGWGVATLVAAITLYLVGHIIWWAVRVYILGEKLGGY